MSSSSSISSFSTNDQPNELKIPIEVPHNLRLNGIVESWSQIDVMRCELVVPTITHHRFRQNTKTKVNLLLLPLRTYANTLPTIVIGVTPGGHERYTMHSIVLLSVDSNSLTWLCLLFLLHSSSWTLWNKYYFSLTFLLFK